MNKEEALTEFLKGLRVAINNSLAYSRQHPYFIKSAQEFKEKVDGLFNFINPIKINATPEALFSDGKELKKIFFSVEMAHFLHQRKVRGMEFRPGLTVNEVADFLSLLSMQPKEIFKKGGLSHLLSSAKIEAIRVEDLDYSGLLGAKGEEAKDIWLYLFKDTIENRNLQEINELAGNFSESVNNLSLNKVIEDDKLREDLRSFLHYLKESKNENFSKCSQELSNVVVNSGVRFSPEALGKLKEVFQDLDNNDFSNILLFQLSKDSDLNSLSIGLFSRLAGEEKADNIASELAVKFAVKGNLQNKTAFAKKVKDLLSGPDTTNISPAYRAALSALVKNISPEERFFFDRSSLRVNYRMIALNLLLQEASPIDLDLILNRLNQEWEFIAQEKDYGFLRQLLDALKQKKANFPPDLFESIEKGAIRIIEDSVWDIDENEDLRRLIDSLEKVYSPVEFYLNRIFQEKKYSAYGLKLFLKFFPSQMNIFYERLREARSDLEFINHIIRIMGKINSSVSLAVLKEIFSFGNEFVKIEALKAMQESSEFDPEFIFPILQYESRVLKKIALEVLLRDSITRQKALKVLLEVKSLWGIKNQLILDNITIIEELKVKEAIGYLASFSKKRFFWNRKLRDKALQLLKEWG